MPFVWVNVEQQRIAVTFSASALTTKERYLVASADHDLIGCSERRRDVSVIRSAMRSRFDAGNVSGIISAMASGNAIRLG
jgi:hypothetical protein